jgi:hypothetical protein
MPKGIVSDAKGEQGIQGTPLRGIKGGKVDLEFDSKSVTYNPREFRADKGPRK